MRKYHHGRHYERVVFLTLLLTTFFTRSSLAFLGVTHPATRSGFLSIVHPNNRCRRVASSSPTRLQQAAKDNVVLVIGGTSGIGQLVTEKLAATERVRVRATTRSQSKGEELFAGKPHVDVVALDLLSTDTNPLQQAMDGATAVVISIGTTAFPTLKWRGGNTPQAIDADAVTRIAHIVQQTASVQTVVLVTSVGVERTKEMPFTILNLFGVLDAKRAGEEAIRACGTSYVILRPGRLVGGPFTNLDVAKLLQIQGGAENGVNVAPGDALLGDCKRDACAECIVQALAYPAEASNKVFSIVSNDDLPAKTTEEWKQTFASL